VTYAVATDESRQYGQKLTQYALRPIKNKQQRSKRDRYELFKITSAKFKNKLVNLNTSLDNFYQQPGDLRNMH